MKKVTDYYKMRWLMAFLLVLLATIVLFMSSGCEILKTRSELKTDSTHKAALTITTYDTAAGGSVIKTTTDSKDEYEKWRAIFTYPPRDTNVNVTNVYPQPTTVIYEREKGTKTEATNTTDSSWFVNVFKQLFDALDSTNSKVDRLQKGKHSTTPGLGLVTTIALILGAFVLLKGAGFVISNYSFTKKK